MTQTIDQRARSALRKAAQDAGLINFVTMIDEGDLDEFDRVALAALTEALTRIEELEAENKDLKSSVVAFGAVHAVRHAKDCGLPEGHLEAAHYDILSRAGARMVDFKRHDSAALTKGIKE